MGSQDITRSYSKPSGSPETIRSRPDRLIRKILKNDSKITQKGNLYRASDPCKVYSWSCPSGESKIIVIYSEEKYGETKRTWNF